MSITAKQSKLIHMACNRAGLDDAQYRVLLHNTARVASSKDLDQRGFEDVMAVLEDYENRGGDTGGNTYWRDKVATRGTRNNERMLHLIRELAVNQRYDLAAMCQRFSRGRTDQADQLNSREQWKLIEMLKAAVNRDAVPKSGLNAARASSLVTHRSELLFPIENGVSHAKQERKPAAKPEPVQAVAGVDYDDEEPPF
jgi:hypothetical protein